MIHQVKNMDKVKELFSNWEETIIWSCLQGVMGKMYANHIEIPTSAMAILGDFAFLAGEPDSKLVSFKPKWFQNSFVIMVPQTKEWGELIETCYGEECKKVTRYAFKKEKDIFQKDRLEAFAHGLPSEYELRLIDEPLFMQCRRENWSQDLVGQFDTYKDYEKLGIGVVVIKNSEIVAGASSYSRYLDGIEIEMEKSCIKHE